MNRGKFVVVEGVDGSGKTTLARKLELVLEERGFDVLYTWEPGFLPETRKFLEPVFRGEVKEGAFLLFLYDRFVHVRRVIEPHLKKGGWVICDRYHLSTVVYQGVDLKTYFAVHRALSLPEPDVLLVLHGCGDGFWSRLKVPTEFERLKREEMRRMDEKYARLAREVGGVLIDARKPPDEVLREAIKALEVGAV